MRPPAQPLENLIGRTLNHRYLVEDKIGEGGFGAVFRGKQIATGREVALKILHPHNVADQTIVARFRREAEACSKLRDTHTVTTYDFDETPDGILYLAMELLRGQSLHQVQKSQGPLGVARVLKIVDQVAASLAEAHANGIVHRDMKPENVFIETREGDDHVKVLDFGIAKVVGDERSVPALTAVGQTLGTLEFMSPEQLRGQKLDGRSDIYALGMMSYEMLTGALPFASAKSPIDIINFHMRQEPPAPSTLERQRRDSAGGRRHHPQDGRQGARQALRRTRPRCARKSPAPNACSTKPPTASKPTASSPSSAQQWPWSPAFSSCSTASGLRLVSRARPGRGCFGVGCSVAGTGQPNCREDAADGALLLRPGVLAADGEERLVGARNRTPGPLARPFPQRFERRPAPAL